MKVSIFLPPHLKDIISVSARAEGPGKLLGDLREQVRPGGSFLGWSFEELAALGTGNHDIQPKPGWNPGAGAAGRLSPHPPL